MRLLRLALFCLLIAVLVSIPAFGRSSPQQQTQTTTTQAPQSEQPSQSALGGDFVRNPFTQQNVGQPLMVPKLGETPRFKIKVLPHKRFRHEQLPDPRPRFSDPGIYLRAPAHLGTLCGSIVSYNFSQGDNPHLESITTCTPAGIVESRRAGDDEEKKPPAPALIRTKY